jgi:hypothetical protein
MHERSGMKREVLEKTESFTKMKSLEVKVQAAQAQS